MPEEHSHQEPGVVNLSMSARAGEPTARMSLSVVPADDVIVEDSDTLRKIAAPSGDFLVYKRVFVVVAGHGRVEITGDVSPEEEAMH